MVFGALWGTIQDKANVGKNIGIHLFNMTIF